MKYKLILVSFSLILFAFGQVSKLKIIQIGCLDIRKVVNFVSENVIVKSSLLGVEKKILKQAKDVEENIKLLKKELDQLEESAKKRNEIESQIIFEQSKLEELLKSNLKQSSLESLNQSKLSPRITKGIYRAIQDVSLEKGYSIILEKNQGIVYVSDEVDITDLVIERLKK